MCIRDREYNDGDTFWYHVCPVTNRMTYIPTGKKCPECEQVKIRRAKEYNEYIDELQKGDLL